MRTFLSLTLSLAVSVSVAVPQMQALADPQPAGQTDQMRGQGRMRGFAGQAVQGTVTAVAADKLTLKNDAGVSYDVTVTDTSRVMENRQAIKLTDIKPGDRVMAMGQVDAEKKTVQAMFVNATDAATVAKAKENLGKTYITGRVASIDAENLKLTITRSDSVSQVVAVDDGTSFQRGNRGVAADVAAAGGMATGGGFGGGRGMGAGRGMGEGGMRREGSGGAQAGTPGEPESITLADIKVGDGVMATGSVKNGTFTALKMGVSTSGMGPGGRRGQQGPAPAGGPDAPPPPPPQ